MQGIGKATYPNNDVEQAPAGAALGSSVAIYKTMVVGGAPNVEGARYVVGAPDELDGLANRAGRAYVFKK